VAVGDLDLQLRRVNPNRLDRAMFVSVIEASEDHEVVAGCPPRVVIRLLSAHLGNIGAVDAGEASRERSVEPAAGRGYREADATLLLVVQDSGRGSTTTH
jgi:hypothetical protein